MKQFNAVLAVILSLFCFPQFANAVDIKVTNLKCNYLNPPASLQTLTPNFAWQLTSKNHATSQSAYQLMVATSPDLLKKNTPDLYNTGKVKSDQSLNIPYKGKKLNSRDQCFWMVRVWDNLSNVSKYSKIASFNIPLLKKSDWSAKWITSPFKYNSTDPNFVPPAPYFRKDFTTNKKIARANLYITGLGYHNLYINNKKISDHFLDPAFTRYDKTVLYMTHDVTTELRKGVNSIGVILGEGWYSIRRDHEWRFNLAPWHADPALIAQLEINYTDGSKKIITSNIDWKCAESPLIINGIRMGQIYDAAKEIPNWASPDFDDSNWKNAEVVKGPAGKLIPQQMPPARIHTRYKPVKITEPKPGVYLFDFAQNLAGWAELKIKAPAGTKIKLRYAERLLPDGTIDNHFIKYFSEDPNFHADTYIAKGKATETWHPDFTYYGFQYVQVEGLPHKPDKNTLTACFVSTDFDTAGSFECSDTTFNKLQHACRKSFLANYQGYPTDCPHREKNGWTGDAHHAAESGMLNFNTIKAYQKWSRDITDAQLDNGRLPGIIPTAIWGYGITYWKKGGFGPVWDSAAILIPWYLYTYYGDTKTLAAAYPTMQKYMLYVANEQTKDFIPQIGLGDWLPAKKEAPRQLTRAAFYYDDAKILGQIAQILDKPADAKKYNTLAQNIADALNKKIFTENIYDGPGTQAVLSSALFYDLVPPNKKQATIEKLITDIKQNDNHLTTGFIGTKHLIYALTNADQTDLAFKLITQPTPPSFGYWIQQGATTLWEHWKGDTGSLNHPSYNYISSWAYHTLAGIQPEPQYPGFKHFTIAPKFIKSLDWVKAAHISPYGKITTQWKRNNQSITLTITIPPNTTAKIIIPANLNKIKGLPPQIKPQTKTPSQTILQAPSGTYTLKFPKK